MNKAYDLALADRGVKEWKEGHNPKVLAYFEDVGHGWVQDDETAWCAAFVGAMLKRAGMAHTGKLNARSYLAWGEEVAPPNAQPGDIVVFWRGSPDSWQGHVGFFVRYEGESVIVLGGNQGNEVGFAAYPKARLIGVRRAPNTIETAPPSPASKGRTSPAQSTTLQAASGAVAGAATVAGTAVSQLDGTAQIVVIVAAAVIGLCVLWIMRERLRKWAQGVR